MAKKILGYIKLQVPAGSATPSPPIGPRSKPVWLSTFGVSSGRAIRQRKPGTAWVSAAHQVAADSSTPLPRL